jgi:CheY-like chemotaxis protein
MEKTHPLKIIHVDDSDVDALVVSHVLRECPHANILKHFPSASEAIKFLDSAAEGERPDLILCDLKMPGMSGHDFLRWLRGSRHKTVPTVIFSSSDFLEDIREAYVLGANSFLIKPLARNEILNMMNAIVEYWRRCNLVERRPDM